MGRRKDQKMIAAIIGLLLGLIIGADYQRLGSRCAQTLQTADSILMEVH
jgi:hypothetical protein